MSESENKKPGTTQGTPPATKAPDKTIFDRLKDLPGVPIKKDNVKSEFDRNGVMAQVPQQKKEE